MMGRSWSAISVAALLLTGMLAFTGCDNIKATFDRKGYLEEQAVSNVNKMFRMNDINQTCQSVRINEDLGGGRYRATVFANDQLKVIITDKRDQMIVGLDLEDQNTVMAFAKSTINRNLGGRKSCTRLDNPRKLNADEYLATAVLSDGRSEDVKIAVSGNSIRVIPARNQ